MLLPNVLLSDDVNASATSTSTTTTTSTTSTSTSTSITSTTHISLNSLPPPLNLNLNLNSAHTFNDDVHDDSSKHSTAASRQMEMAHKSMAMSSIAPMSKSTSNGGCAKRFPVYLVADEARRTLHFPLKARESQPNKINCFKNEHHPCTATHEVIENFQLCLSAKFPISNEASTKSNTRNEFPRNCRSSIAVENKILAFQILPFLDDLKMPQAAAANATHTTTTTATTSTPKTITHSTDLAASATTFYGGGARREGQPERQETQVQCAQVQSSDEARRASSNDAPNDGAADDGVERDEPTGETSTMDKNSNLETDSGRVSSTKIMSVCDGSATDTHNTEAEKEQAAAITESESSSVEPNLAAFAHRRNHSDVRDTSSQEVVVVVVAVDTAAASGQCGTCPQPEASQRATATPTTRQALTSPAAVDATPPPATAASVYDKLPNLELLPNYYALELWQGNARNRTERAAVAAAQAAKRPVECLAAEVKNSKIKLQPVESDTRKQTSSKRDSNATQATPLDTLERTFEGTSGAAKQRLRSAFSEMTLTQLEEHDAATTQLSSSEPASPVPSLEEMKFEMRATKAVLPPSSVHERFKHERQQQTPTPTASSSTAALLRLSQAANAASLPTSSLARSQSTPLAAAAYAPRNAAAELRNSTRLAARPANSEAATRRENDSNRSASISAAEAVLPARTVLRRQRRLASQHSADRDEDPIERLNRLRARISGALSEVKGVLNKYSTETEPPSEPATTTAAPAQPPKPVVEKPAEGPVQFRFVRKVRRRSVFAEDDAATAESQKHETVEKTGAESSKENDLIKEIKAAVSEKSAQHTFLEEAARKLPKITEQLQVEEMGSSKEAQATATEASINDGTQKSKAEKATKSLDREAQKAAAPQTELLRETPLNVAEREKSPSKQALERATEVQEAQLKQESAVSNETQIQNEKAKILPKIEIDKAAGSTQPKAPKKLAVEPKEAQRRASTGAMREAAADTATQLPSCKSQRRPSDSAAVVKGKKLQQAAATTVEKRSELRTTKKATSVDHEQTPRTGAAAKATAENAEAVDKTSETIAPNDAATTKSKKRAAVKRADSLRRASIAAVEKSKIEPPLKAQTAQRRASDAAVEAKPQPATAKSKLIARRPTPRVKAGAKAKRASPIANETANDESVTTRAAAARLKAESAAAPKSSIKVINDAPAATPPAARTALLSASLPVVIDSAPSSAVVDAIKGNSQHTAAKADGQSVAIATAVPTSLVPSNTADSQKARAIDAASLGSLAGVAGHNNANELINQALATPEKASTTGSVNLAETPSIDGTKKPIHQAQQAEIPAPPQLTQPHSQQVAAGAPDGVPEAESASEVKRSSNAVGEAATKAARLAAESSSGAQTSTTASARASTELVAQQPIAAAVEHQSHDKMPELQISPAPVKAVQIPADNRKFAPLNLPREELPKKKIVFKKIVRQKSTEKPQSTVERRPTTAADVEAANEAELVVVEVADGDGEYEQEAIVAEEAAESAVAEAAPKKPRKVKKKVIIKRQQRRLSISDQTFFSSEIGSDQQVEHGKAITETLEKAIAYVTDDEDDASAEAVPEAPLKGCMRQREFQVGDLVMYAERYKRTQVRWKRGRVLERITSISYKLDIEGKEVPAHISYIKRYTDRKVSFGGKEYLEIDYEHIAEEVEKVRSYSIWNMV